MWQTIAVVEGRHLKGRFARKYFGLTARPADAAVDVPGVCSNASLFDPARFHLVARLLRGGCIEDNAHGLAPLDLIAWLDKMGDLAEKGPDPHV